jgi:myosin heavy subunit
MAGEGKALKLILIVLILISLGLAGVAFFNLQQEQAKSARLQNELEGVKTKQKITETKLEETKKMVSSLEGKLKENLDQIDALNQELAQVKTEKNEAVTQLQQLTSEVESQKKLRADLEERVAQIQNDAKSKEEQLSALAAKKTELETKIKDLEEKSKSIELGKIVVTPEPVAPVAEATPTVVPIATIETTQQVINAPVTKNAGKVLVVNKEYNFLVINLGSKDGIKVGDEFLVYHNDKNIGVTKVEKVHDFMSSLGFDATATDIKEQVVVGDKVAKK